MIKEYLDQETLDCVMNALRNAHSGKEVIFVDMDGVIADFESKATEQARKMNLTLSQFLDQKQYRHQDSELCGTF